MNGIFFSTTRRKRSTTHVSQFVSTSSPLQRPPHKPQLSSKTQAHTNHQVYFLAIRQLTTSGRCCLCCVLLPGAAAPTLIPGCRITMHLNGGKQTECHFSTEGTFSAERVSERSSCFWKRQIPIRLCALRRWWTYLQCHLLVRNSSISTSEGRPSRCFAPPSRTTQTRLSRRSSRLVHKPGRRANLCTSTAVPSCSTGYSKSTGAPQRTPSPRARVLSQRWRLRRQLASSISEALATGA